MPVLTFQHCIFCYKESTASSKKPRNKQKEICRKFCTLASRSLKLNPLYFLSDKTLSSKLSVNVTDICDGCLQIASSYCDLYYKMDYIKMQMNWRIFEMTQVMKKADKDGSPNAAYREALKDKREAIGDDMENIDGFRNEFLKAVTEKRPGLPRIVITEKLKSKVDAASAKEQSSAVPVIDADVDSSSSLENYDDDDDSSIFTPVMPESTKAAEPESLEIVSYMPFESDDSDEEETDNENTSGSKLLNFLATQNKQFEEKNEQQLAVELIEPQSTCSTRTFVANTADRDQVNQQDVPLLIVTGEPSPTSNEENNSHPRRGQRNRRPSFKKMDSAIFDGNRKRKAMDSAKNPLPPSKKTKPHTAHVPPNQMNFVGKRTGIKSVKCSQCPKTFANKGSLQTHERVVHKIYYVCPFCDVETSYPGYLVFHLKKNVQKCLGNRPSDFDVRTFNINDHKKMGTPLATTTQSSMSNERESDKENHAQEVSRRRTHKTISLAKKLLQLAKRAKPHAIASPVPQGRKILKSKRTMIKSQSKKFNDFSASVKCSKCPKLFSRMDSLKQHEEAVHHKICYECPFCESKFSFRNNFRSHLRKNVKGCLEKRPTDFDLSTIRTSDHKKVRE